MGERHKHADVIIAWANGADIQYRVPEEGEEWSTVSSEWNRLGWFDDNEYRIKPSVITKWIWTFKGINSSKWKITDHYFTEQEAKIALSGRYTELVKIEESMVEEECDAVFPANPRTHADIICAWAEGATIQYWCDGKWVNVTEESPCWSPEVKFRIKPKTVTKWYWVLRAAGGLAFHAGKREWVVTNEPYSEEELPKVFPHLIGELHKIEASKVEVEE